VLNGSTYSCNSSNQYNLGTINSNGVTGIRVGNSGSYSTGNVSLPTYPTTLPASDVYSWAKASTKPSYTASEVGALSSSTAYVKSVKINGSTYTASSAGATVDLGTITATVDKSDCIKNNVTTEQTI